MTFPKTIGACIDSLYKLRQEKSVVAKKVDDISQKAKELEDHIITEFSKAKIDGAAGKLAKLSISRSTVPTIDDRDALIKHIKKTGDVDLLQIRLSTTAVKERWDDNKKVPGVKTFDVVKISLTKVTKK